MRRGTREIRERFFVAVEGESEQSFFKWLQTLSEGRLFVHLDTVPLNGGGYRTMLEEAVRQLGRRTRMKKYESAFLVVDLDRAERGDDGWSMDKLRRQAVQKGLELFAQRPNHEGLLLRLVAGLEQETPNLNVVETKLRKYWPEYQKPMNAHELERRFIFEDLARAAKFDDGLRNLLRKIGFKIN